ncbi:MAG: hypothetical protein JOZ72_00565 [Alphaproteobacteria bacterium]|nr:hypothetical protein [Alphaproteobacteria bacterium]
MTQKNEQPVAPEPATPLPAYPVDLAPELLRPEITEVMLRAQLAEALFLIRDAGFLYRNTGGEPIDRGGFVNHAEGLMQSSIKVADCIARLNGAAPPAAEKRARKKENE